MKALLLREIKSFFGSPIGYLVIGIFLLLNGLFLWVFEGEFNILNSGFADMSPFFKLAPWILIFLIPSVTMRSFSDEKKQGTIELLFTKPLSNWDIVNGKFLGALVLIILAIVPTIIYVLTISHFGNPQGNIDMGSTLGSYFGLLFLIASYTAIGIFASTLSDNQIVAFIIAVFCCFFFYFGFDGIASFLGNYSSMFAALGMDYHFKSMSRGVLDTRDILYFLSVTYIFLQLTIYQLKPIPKTKNNNSSISSEIKLLLISSVSIVLFNILSQFFFKRFDLTQDKRYTLSETTLNIIKDVESPLYIEVYLEGNFPPEFKRLQNETKQLLEEFTAYNSNIIFNFKNPIEKEETRVEKMKEFYAKGMQPLSITVEDKGKQSQEVVFPWAQATYGDRFTKVALLKNLMGASTEEKVISSVQHLEFGFAEAINKISKEKQKKIAVIKGNGELIEPFMADFLKTVKESYYIGPFTLDSVAKQPTQTLEALKKYDLAVIAKPTEAFTEEEKQVLDQFIMNGGKTLWLVDVVSADMDSLYNETGTILAAQRELNLTDMFFKYGIRINPLLVKDEYATPIKLASGNQGSETQMQEYSWKFAPFIYPTSTNPIVKNMEGIKFEFASPIEILKNDIKKTVLLSSSEYSKTIGTPSPISLDMVTEETTPEEYEGKGLLPVAVLMEGKFKSAYQNRVLPFKDNSFQATGKENKMIVISDGDVIKNQLDKGVPLELGFDKWTNQLYGNKEFLMNCVNYLLDDNGLINIRSKDVDLPLLNKEEVYKNYTTAQMVTVGLPIVILAIFGFLFTFLRKRKYSR